MSEPPPRLRLLAGVGEPVRRNRPACRFREATKAVPEGHLVRHPRCPLCGERLAYRVDGEQAWRLHVHDPRFRLSPVD